MHVILSDPTDINECQHNNGNCDHSCTNTNGSYVCSCNMGYELSPDGHTCTGKQHSDSRLWLQYTAIDIDECSVNNGGCEHNCTNTEGSFVCSCVEGYSLERNMFCEGKLTTDWLNYYDFFLL